MHRATRLSRGLRARLLAAAGLLFCLVLSAGLLSLGSDLDADSLLPFQGSEEGTTTITGPTGDDGPSPEARVTLSLLAAITALPVLSPRRAFRACLVVSACLVGLFAALTALRLGLLFTPIPALQAIAYVQATPEN